MDFSSREAMNVSEALVADLMARLARIGREIGGKGLRVLSCVVALARGPGVRVRIARRDLKTAGEIAETSPAWAFNIVYNAMHQTGRAFLLRRGYRTVG